MRREGFGQEAAFYVCHPIVNFIYYVLVIGIAMFSTHPVFLAISLMGSCLHAVMWKGISALRQDMKILVLLILVMVVINTASAHDGDTVLFYLNNNRITVEAMIYGLAAAVLLTSVIIWFGSVVVIVSPDKFIYLFGRTVPVFALLLSMIFRFIPLLKQRYREITDGQRCMGREISEGSPIRRMHQLMKEISILIAWSLEASIETSSSMEARGYGLSGRTSFHLYRFTRRDGMALAAILFFGGIAVTGCVLGKTAMYYYPVIRIPWSGAWYPVTAVSFVALIFVPVVIEIVGEKRWKQWNFEM